MIESKFSAFFRSPLGILVLTGLLILGGLMVFLYVRSVVNGLVNFTPAPL